MKKLFAVLVALVCIAGIFSSCANSPVSSGAETRAPEQELKLVQELKVDAWIESKFAKPGDVIKVYATTSYIDGVSVSADIMEYEHSESAITSLLLGSLNPSGIIYTVYVTTISLSYDPNKKYWVGEYTIPATATGGYVAEVTATDGTKTAKDNATIHLIEFYENWLAPVQENATIFLEGEFNDTINSIRENLTVLNESVAAHGGIRGVVKNLTALEEWQALLEACNQPGKEYYGYFSEKFSGTQSFEYNFAIKWVDYLCLHIHIFASDTPVSGNWTLIYPNSTQDIHPFSLEPYEAYGWGICMCGFVPSGNWKINITTQGNGSFDLTIDAPISDLYKLRPIGQFLDNLTKFILSPEYENITSMIPELESFIEGIPEENVLDYLLGFNLTEYLNKIAGTEGITEAYNTLLSSDEYTKFKDALCALELEGVDAWAVLNFTSALINLALADDLMNLLNATQNYLQGNETYLQNLTRNLSAVYDLPALIQLPEFENLTNAVLANESLSGVYNCANITYHNITARIEQMLNSSQLQALNESIQKLVIYTMTTASFLAGGGFEGTLYFEGSLSVSDWVKGLEINVELYPYMTGSYINVTLTDPNGVEYLYTYNETKCYGFETIHYPAPGNWSYNVTIFGSGKFNLGIAPAQEFPEYMLLETIEELFFVFNASIAIETEPFVEIGTSATAKLIAYDVNGRVANETLNVTVVRKHPIYGSPVAASWLYGFMVEGVPVEGIMTPTASCICLYLENNYTVRLEFISQPVHPSDVRWQLRNPTYTTVLYGDVTTDGYTSDDVTVTWLDNDMDGMLSAGDNLTINASGVSLKNYRFKLTYIPTGGIMLAISLGGGGKAILPVDAKTPSSPELPADILQLLPILQLAMPEIIYKATLTTDSNGEVTITFPVHKYGLYSVYAAFETEGKFGFGTADVFGEQYIPGISLTQLGKFSGMPVYKSPGKVGKDIVLPVEVPEGAEAYAFVVPIPLKDIYPSVEVSYEASFSTTNVTTDLSLQVNGPVSLIGLVTMPPMPKEEVTPEMCLSAIHQVADANYLNITWEVVSISRPDVAWSDLSFKTFVNEVSTYSDITYNDWDANGYVMATETIITGFALTDVSIEDSLKLVVVYIPTDSTVCTAQTGYYGKVLPNEPPTYTEPRSSDQITKIPDMNITYGLLLASDVDVTITPPITGIIKNELALLEVTPSSGTPHVTSGVAMCSNGVDVIALDVKTLSKLLYINITEGVPINLTELVKVTEAFVFGYGNIGFIKIPLLSADGNYSIITITEIDNTKFGTALTEVIVYTTSDILLPVIEHTPITAALRNTTITINATIRDNRFVIAAKLFYRKVGETNYTEVQMSNPEGNLWTAPLPASAVTQAGLEYYIWATDGKNNATTSVYTISPDITAPDIIHTPITLGAENAAITINATITENTTVEGVYNVVTNASLFYRKVGETNYTEIQLSNPEGNLWTAIIPASAVTGVGLEYYIWATDGKNNATTSVHTIVVPTTIIRTIEGKEVTVAYNGTGELTVRSATVSEIEVPQENIPAGKKMVGMFLVIETTGILHEAFITINYTDEDVAGLDENSLRMYYWNETRSKWVLIEESGVWTNNNTVWARITHLTIFAPLTEEVAAKPFAPTWMIYTGILAAVIIIIAVSLAVMVRKKKKKIT